MRVVTVGQRAKAMLASGAYKVYVRQRHLMARPMAVIIVVVHESMGALVGLVGVERSRC